MINTPYYLPIDTSGRTSVLIYNYKNGSVDAATELQTLFTPYLRKWLRLLTLCRWDRKDSEIRHFLSMFGKLDYELLAQLVKSKLKAYDREDIEQEIVVAFLECILKYSSITSHFRYVLKERIWRLISDPLVFNYGRNLSFDDMKGEVYSGGKLDYDEKLALRIAVDALEDRDQYILRMVKYHGFTIESVAKSLNVSVSTINRSLARSLGAIKVKVLGGKVEDKARRSL